MNQLITKLIATMSGRKDVVKASGAHLFFHSKHRVIINILGPSGFEVGKLGLQGWKGNIWDLTSG